MNITFRPATLGDARFIAEGFHMAMLYDDAPEQQLQTFANIICTREDVLYSWRNTLIAMVDGQRAGMITAYDGRYYRPWRQQTMLLVKEYLGVVFPDMEDEAVPGEYYLDSLAVLPAFRGQGIGRSLLQQAISQGRAMGLRVTLAVDPVNTRAQHLYASLGFRLVGDIFIFGHTYWKMEM